MKRLLTVWMISIQSGKFPDILVDFKKVWRISGQSKTFPSLNDTSQNSRGFDFKSGTKYLFFWFLSWD